MITSSPSGGSAAASPDRRAGAPTESWLGGLPLRAGAGVFAEAATALTVEDCVLRDMTADWGVGITGPLGGTLTVVDSTFENLDGLAGPAAIAHRGSDARVSGSDFIVNGAAAPHAVGTTVDLTERSPSRRAPSDAGDPPSRSARPGGGGLRCGRPPRPCATSPSTTTTRAMAAAPIEAQATGGGARRGLQPGGSGGGRPLPGHGRRAARGLAPRRGDGRQRPWRQAGGQPEGALVLSDLGATGNEGAALSLAGRSGGASVSVDQALLTDNAGTGFGGGGIHAVDLDALSVHQSRLSSNQGLAGGALSASNVADLRLTSTVLADNVASTFGAGLYAADSGVTLEDASLLRTPAGRARARTSPAPPSRPPRPTGALAQTHRELELTTAGDTLGPARRSRRRRGGLWRLRRASRSAAGPI